MFTYWIHIFSCNLIWGYVNLSEFIVHFCFTLLSKENTDPTCLPNCIVFMLTITKWKPSHTPLVSSIRFSFLKKDIIFSLKKLPIFPLFVYGCIKCNCLLSIFQILFFSSYDTRCVSIKLIWFDIAQPLTMNREL